LPPGDEAPHRAARDWPGGNREEAFTGEVPTAAGKSEQGMGGRVGVGSARLPFVGREREFPRCAYTCSGDVLVEKEDQHDAGLGGIAPT